MAKLHKYDTVLIKWDDAAGSCGWNKDEEDLLKPHQVNTVGFFLAKKNGRILTCGNHAWKHGNHGDYMSIPVKYISHIILLKKARKSKHATK